MGSISEDKTSYYVDKLGYSATDLIGIDGIESAYENQLHGTAGVKKIKVNSSGEYVSTVSSSFAQEGQGCVPDGGS
jgi:penicillin-binding protein 2